MTMATASAMRRVGRAWPAAHSDARAMAEIVLATRDETGLECLAVPFCMTVEAEALGCTVDMGNATVLPHVAVECLTDPARVGDLPEFDPGRSGRAPVVLEAIERLKSAAGDAPVLGGVLGPVTLAAMVMDAGLFLRLTRRDPAAAEKLIAALEPVVVRFALAQHAAGADCVTVAEPSATGEVLGGKHFEKLAAPALIRVLRALRDGGASPILHICGDLRPILPQVALIARSLGRAAGAQRGRDGQRARFESGAAGGRARGERGRAPVAARRRRDGRARGARGGARFRHPLARLRPGPRRRRRKTCGRWSARRHDCRDSTERTERRHASLSDE